MLYIDDTDGSAWLSVVDTLAEREAQDMVLCLYPDAGQDSFPEPFTLPNVEEPLERVVTYPDESETACSARIRVTTELLDALRGHVGDFEDWGDSLAVYAPRERAWIAAFIPHRRVVLVRDDRLRDFLDAAGISVGSESPEDW